MPKSYLSYVSFISSAILRHGDHDGASSTSLSLKLPTVLPSPDGCPVEMSTPETPTSPSTQFHRQHGRNRSLDSAQVQSYLCGNHGSHDVEGLELSPLQLQLVSVGSKSHAQSNITNDRILSLKQQTLCHVCRTHRSDFDTGVSSPDSHQSPQLKCTCATSSDDSGICSGASGTTGSETDDVNSTAAGENYEDFPQDDTHEDFNSPRLSFDSAIMMTDDATSDNVLTSEVLLNLANEEDEELELERTLTEAIVPEEDTSASISATTTATLTDFSSSELEVLPENPPSTPVSAPSSGSSLFSRIRVNSKGSKSQTNNNNNNNSVNKTGATASPSASSGGGITLGSGMRSKLRLNFGKGEKNKSSNKTVAGGSSEKAVTSITTPTSVDVLPSSTTMTILCANNLSEGTTVVEEEEPLSVSEGITAEGGAVKPLAPKSWLLRFFESQVFNMSYAIGYLFTSKEPGVQQYLGTHIYVSFA